MYRTKQYKLSVYHGNDYGELYDLVNDPNEHNNLWENPDAQNLKTQLIKDSFDTSLILKLVGLIWRRSQPISTRLHGPDPQQPSRSKLRPDYGYSSWLTLSDRCIILVDCTNYGDEPEQSHIVAVYIDPEDTT